VLLLLGALGSTMSAANAARSTGDLAGGFRTASGSRLVGPVFPQPAFPSGYHSGWTGWTAVIDVTGSAGPVFDSYVTQAHALGLSAQWSDQACQQPARGDIRCSSFGGLTDVSLYLRLRVCSSCATPVSLMTIQMLGAPNVARTGPPIDDPRPPSRFRVHLTAAMRERQRKALPETGQTIPIESMAPGTRATFSPLRVAAGTRAGFVGNSQTCGDGDPVAVLSSRQSVDEVFDEYSAQVHRQPADSPDPLPEASATLDNRHVKFVQGAVSNVTVVGHGSATFVLAIQCFSSD
jgi:hypothetical protein